MPLISGLTPYEEFLSKVEWLKSNPKTYRTYSYNVKSAKEKFPISAFGNRIWFISVPTKVSIRFNIPENDGINFAKPIGFRQDFFQIFLDWEATATDNPLIFITAWDMELIEMSDIFKKPVDLIYLATPMQDADASVLLGTYDTSLYSELLLDYFSDCDGNIVVETSFDGITFYNSKTIPVNASSGDYKSLPIESNYARISFTKGVGVQQTALNISVRARL